jgi:hypothetical protein
MNILANNLNLLFELADNWMEKPSTLHKAAKVADNGSMLDTFYKCNWRWWINE